MLKRDVAGHIYVLAIIGVWYLRELWWVLKNSVCVYVCVTTTCADTLMDRKLEMLPFSTTYMYVSLKIFVPIFIE